MVAATGSWFDSAELPKVRISITGECNLDCFFCKPLGHDFYQTGVKWVITPQDAGRFARSIADKGISQIEIAGCEPLLRKDASAFVKTISSVKAINDVCLKTNGTYLKNHADALKKAGLKRLEITLTSLNFLKYQKITGRDNLYRVLDGLEKAERLKFNELIVNILVMSGINSDELIDFAMLTKTKNLLVRFVEYYPIHSDEAYPEEDKLNLSILHIKRSIDGFQKLHRAQDDQIEPGVPRFMFKDAVGSVSFMNKGEIDKMRSVSLVALNSMGDIQNTGSTKKSLNIIKELRKDSRGEVLSKILDKQLAQASGKRKRSKTKSVGSAKSTSKRKQKTRRKTAGKTKRTRGRSKTARARA